MKKKMGLILLAVLAVIFGISSCKKENDPNKESDALKRYLEIKSMMASFQNNNGEANLTALEASIMKSRKKILKCDGDSGVIDTGWIDPDTGWIDPDTGWIDPDTAYWESWTCAEVTEYIDNEGNYVTIYDYGVDGCDDWGSLIKGKVTYIWSQVENVYYSKVLYENYSAWGMSMNGYSEYSYTMSDNMFFENPSDSSTTSFVWSGSSSCNEDMEMSYEGSETFHYTANYSSEWDENSYTVNEGYYSYKNITNSYEYTYTVIEDLFYNYECGWEIWVPVKGIEEIIYKDTELNTQFVTDYGDGTCDNIAQVTENGVVFTVDFGEMWYTEPCIDADCDSVVVYVEEP